jgi:hypothetical protein
MLKCLKAFGCCFVLAALFAPGAQAIEIAVDPGVDGEEADSFTFPLVAPETVVDITFTGMKTLEGAGVPAAFSLRPECSFPQCPVIDFIGYLSDESGTEIDGTTFGGKTDTGVVEVDAVGVTWFEMHFEADFRGDEGYTLVWSGASQFLAKPIVGVVPEPGTSLSMVAALATLGVVRRWRRKGSEGTA